jgi:hypothetical protein
MIPLIRRFASVGFQVAFVVALAASSSLAQTSADLNRLPPDEREALVALYNTTGGAQWRNHSGWLGASGTECEWYGVTCDYPAHIQKSIPFVASLDLSNNNLVGAIPPELGRLKSLEWLSLFGNRLTGTVPESLIQRWLAGPLHIAAEAHLLTALSKIDYESNASSLLCARRRIIITSDNTVTVYTTRCRNAAPDDRTTYCEVKEGQVGWAEFARLASFIEKNGFFTLQPEYSRNITDAGFENTRVIRAGKSVEVSNYADAGPLELWSIQRAIEGVAADIEVQKTTQRATCPRW